MSTKAGQLLWSRKRINLEAGAPTLVDTGLTQVSKSFSGEPGVGDLGERINVMPLAPLSKWNGVEHSDPYFNPTTGTVWVTFASTIDGRQDLNVLFWNPHSAVGPGQADPYSIPV